jgi:hypothetical protein
LIFYAEIVVAMKQYKIRFSLATAVFLAGATAAFAQTVAPVADTATATATATATHAMTPAQIAFKHHKLPKSFTTEAAAKASCKSTVIWAETKSKVYYPQTATGFGTALPGVYACVRDAVKAGYHKSAA